MNALEALLLGLIQGLTEFLPVSSSGHLELGKAILGIEVTENITFTVVVHGATVLSTLVVFWQEIIKLLKGSLSLQMNESSHYISRLLISAIPVVIAGLFLEDYIESFFSGDIQFVGFMLIITAILLAFSNYAKSREKNITYRNAFIIGLAQMFAVLPGISRSGSTIATGLLLGNKRGEVAQFSFLMVLLPIIGANLLTILKGEINANADLLPLIVGFVGAFVSGWIACKWMISIVKKGKLIYFAIYCFAIGTIAIILG
ncbi:MAG: UDP-diphosphatase [Bacteroidetes bacterium]|jgi:undecaprenyl-diphosphatase|nr:UDP-diphosphatase [Bacteroidota bacterium]